MTTVSNGTPNLLAIIPAYNEARAIEDVVRRTRPHVRSVLVVDDGSVDETVTLAGQAGATVLSHPFNLGKATALQSGFDYALKHGFDLVVTLDGDGQHDPAEIPGLLGVWRREDAHIVAGDRLLAGIEMPLSRRAVNRLTAWIARKVVGRQLPDCHCGFRLIDTEVLKAVRLHCRRFAGDSELLVFASFRSFRIRSLPVSCSYNGEGSQIEPIGDAARLLFLGFLAAVERVRLELSR
jgi:glycosyltransferase involved in cell wall biosynthesis